MKHRVIHKPKEKLDIALVVPCYDEGIDVIPLLYSAAIQMHLEKTQIGVFLVINHGAPASEGVRISNRITARLIIDILRNTIEKYRPEEQKRIQMIQRSGIHIGIIDMFSKKGSPEICNVGYARDEGTRAILPFLKDDDSVICHTDADCTLEAGYFWSIEQNFLRPSYFLEQKEKIYIATGGREFKKDPRIENNLYEKVSYIENMIERYIFQKYMSGIGKVNEEIHYTPGSHIIFRKGFFEEIQGFPHTSGAEDVAIGVQARQKGKKVHFILAEISTLSRISTRTQKGHGYGFDVERKSKGDSIEEIFSSSSEFLEAFFKGRQVFLSAHILYSNQKEKWKNFITLSLKHICSDISQDDIDILTHLYFSHLGGLNSDEYNDLENMIPQLFTELHLIFEKYFPNDTLKQIIKKIDKETDVFLDEILGNTIKILGKIIEMSKKHQTFLEIVKMFLVIHLKNILTNISQLRLYREKIQDKIMDQDFALKYMYGFSKNGELLFDIGKNIDRILDTIDSYIMLFTESVFQNHELEVHYLGVDEYTRNTLGKTLQESINLLGEQMQNVEQEFGIRAFDFFLDMSMIHEEKYSDEEVENIA